MMKEILYVGSGNSATRINEFREGRKVCLANNAWRLWRDGDTWIHSGDFPSRPSLTIPKELIVSHGLYSKAAKECCEYLQIKTSSPEHYVGYTIFLQGLNWIAWNFRPCRILLLGFDHDYNVEKVAKWEEIGRPNPQNHFKGFDGKSADEVFSGYKPDFFYGHGTPDPMRLKASYLQELFLRASETLARLGCECFNASGVTNGLNTFPQYEHNIIRALPQSIEPSDSLPEQAAHLASLPEG